MYNDKSAKDLLAQFPKRMAEGGEAAKEQQPIAPVAARQAVPRTTMASPEISASQRFAMERAAQQELLNNALAQAGMTVRPQQRQEFLERVYAGDINAQNIQEKVLNPLYEERVQNAYKYLGRTGAPAQDDPYLNQLKSGQLSSAEFQEKFLRNAAEVGDLESRNKARVALGLPPLKAKIGAKLQNILSKSKARRKGIGFLGVGSQQPQRGIGFIGSGLPRQGFQGTTTADNQGFQGTSGTGLASILAKSLPKAPAPEPAPLPVKPVDFGLASPTQLFADGGEVTPVQYFKDGSDQKAVSKADRVADYLRLLNELKSEEVVRRKGEMTGLQALGGMPLSPDYYAKADDIIVEKAAEKDLKDYDKRIASQAIGTNTAADPSRYIRKSSPLFPFKGQLTASGWVNRNFPDQVHVGARADEDFVDFIKGIKASNPEMQPAFDRIGNKNDLDTLVHEMTHSNQLNEAFLSDRDYERGRRIRQRYRDEIELQNPENERRYVNPMSGSGLKERELGAYLNAYEGLHPSAKTVSGKDAVIPFERTYLGRKVLPPATGLMKLLEDMGSFGPLSELKDPATREYVDKMMGRTKRKPTPKKLKDGGEVGHPNEAADMVASWGRKQQENLAGLVGLSDEVKFANEIPTRYFSKEEQLDGRGDAMRHLLLQAQIQKKYGDTAAELAGWIHENVLTGGQSDEEKAMDVANDALGRRIGARSADKADMAYKALQAIKSGEAKTILKGTKPKKFDKGGEVKEEPSVFGRKGKQAKIVEGNPYNTEGPPITNNGPSLTDAALFINSFMPITGDIQSAAEAYQAYKDKDYVGASLGAVGMLPLVPNITKYVKGARQLPSELTKEDAIKTAIEEYKNAYKKQGRFVYDQSNNLEGIYKETYDQNIKNGWDAADAHKLAMDKIKSEAEGHSNWFGGGGAFNRQKNNGMVKVEEGILERLKTNPNISKEKGANNTQSEYDKITQGLARKAADESYKEFENKMLGIAGKAKSQTAPTIIVPKRDGIKDIMDQVRRERGEYMARRVERAADEVPNLEQQYNQRALKEAFGESNPQALMVMDPKNFEEYANPLNPYLAEGQIYPSIANAESRFNKGDLSGTNSFTPLTQAEYLDYLAKVAREKGFADVPYLTLKGTQKGGVRIGGHEGRHRTRALSKAGDKSTLVRLIPDYDLTSSKARENKEDYIEALKARLGLDPTVQPEVFPDVEIPMPDVFKHGGEVTKYIKSKK